MPKKRKSKKRQNSNSKKRTKDLNTSYLEKVKKTFRKQHDKAYSFIFQYHSLPFAYFHDRINSLPRNISNYRKDFWKNILPGIYDPDPALEYLQRYKSYLEDKMKQIVEKYSISYWMHVSRRIAPEVSGSDHRRETIHVCRNIMTASFQKYGGLNPCGKIKLLSEIKLEEVLKGLLLKPEFESTRKLILEAPDQLVLTDFDELKLLEYYELEKLAYEMWYVGSKSRVISKGAHLIIDHGDHRIVLDNRSKELSELIEIFDQRTNPAISTATGTVFEQPNSGNSGTVLVPQVFIDRSAGKYFDPIFEWLNFEFPSGMFPNYQLVPLNIKTFLHTHLEFAEDYSKKWNVKLEYVLAVITDICLSYLSAIVVDKSLSTAINITSRAYQLYLLEEFKKGLTQNWQTTVPTPNKLDGFLKVV